MGVVQDFDEAVLQLEAFVQLLPQDLQLRDEAGSFTAIAVVAAVVEVQRGFGDGFQPGEDLLGQLQAALIAEGLAFRRQLLVDLEVSGRYIVQQQLAEMLEFFGVGRRCLNTAQGIEGLHQLLALMQPAIDQLVHTPPPLLGITAAFEHVVLASLFGRPGESSSAPRRIADALSALCGRTPVQGADSGAMESQIMPPG